MTPNAFLEGVESACSTHKINIIDLVKLAAVVAQRDEAHPQGMPMAQLTSMATGAAPAQVPQTGIAQLVQSLNDMGRYSKPLQPRQPFAN